ncbi:MAG: hypothetical protein K940chlam5_00258 [Candidatus Anoxychlamydiales bacterium]|nr:hypothetical protein [Candidatus Anoxychlamydiales bacterium]NGX48668.1 hypothetical protein [Candidatus Anoxychlamydiales bacterium]
MKTSKLIIISILFLILCGSSVFAGKGNGGGSSGDEQGRGPAGDTEIGDVGDVGISSDINPSVVEPEPPKG